MMFPTTSLMTRKRYLEAKLQILNRPVGYPNEYKYHLNRAKPGMSDLHSSQICRFLNNSNADVLQIFLINFPRDFRKTKNKCFSGKYLKIGNMIQKSLKLALWLPLHLAHFTLGLGVYIEARPY